MTNEIAFNNFATASVSQKFYLYFNQTLTFEQIILRIFIRFMLSKTNSFWPIEKIPKLNSNIEHFVFDWKDMETLVLVLYPNESPGKCNWQFSIICDH